MAEEFRRERKTLTQIEKARDAVSRKYRILKEGKQAIEKALGETFKPIVNPLERVVTATDTNARTIKNLMPRKTEVKDVRASSHQVELIMFTIKLMIECSDLDARILQFSFEGVLERAR